MLITRPDPFAELLAEVGNGIHPQREVPGVESGTAPGHDRQESENGSEKPQLELTLLRDAEIDRLAGADTDPYESARALAREAEHQHRNLTDYLCEHRPDLLNEHDNDRQITAAESIIGTCKRLDIALRLGDDGCLVLGREEPAVPPSLVMTMEAHVDEIGRLLQKEPAPTHANDVKTLFRLTRPPERRSTHAIRTTTRQRNTLP
jgi:hypothetical protein